MKQPYITETELLGILKEKNISMSPLIKKAFMQSRKTHGHQKRDNGGPYIEQHIYPVVADIINYYLSYKKKKGVPEELIAGALLHDVLEDDPKMTDERFIRIFGRNTYDIVKPLTKPPHDRNTPNYVMQLINRMVWENVKKSGEETIIIKLADRTNNMEAFFGFSDLDFPKFYRYMDEVQEEHLPYCKKHNKYFYDRLRAIVKELKKRSRKG